MNWGNPSTWDNFCRHVTRAQYRTLELGKKVSPSTKLLYVGHFLRLFWVQFTPYVLIPIAVMGWGYFDKARRERLLLSGIFLFNTIVLLLILRFSFEAENMTRVEEYYLPAYACAAVLIAGGLSGLPRLLEGIVPAKAALGLSLLAPMLPLASHWNYNNMSAYYLAHDYNRVILESLEKDALYFAAGDYNAFPTIYLQAVEGMRTDVILADVTGQLSRPATEYLRSLNPEADPKDKRKTQAEMIGKGERPVYFTAKSDIKDPSSWRIEPWGLVYRVRPKDSKALDSRPDDFKEGALRNLAVSTSLDDMAQSILSNYFLMWGEALAATGRRNEALAKYELAAVYGQSSKEALNNIGATCGERGLMRPAERLFRMAASRYPAYITARRNLARILEQQSKQEEALAVYRQLEEIEPHNESLRRKIASLENTVKRRPPADLDRMLREILAALEEDPKNPALHNNLGNVYAEKGQAREALQSYHKAIEADPKYYKVYKNMAVFYRNVMHDERQAALYMERFQTMKRLEDGRRKAAVAKQPPESASVSDLGAPVPEKPINFTWLYSACISGVLS